MFKYILLTLFFILLVRFLFKKRKKKSNNTINHIPEIGDDFFSNNYEIEDEHLEVIKDFDGFVKQKILNKEESKVFYIVKNILKSSEFKDWLLLCQVSFGEIVKTTGGYLSTDAYFAINSKRVDMLIADKYGYPVLIIEYWGSGHFGDDRYKTIKRDLIKSTVAKKAGIGFCIIDFNEMANSVTVANKIKKHLLSSV